MISGYFHQGSGLGNQLHRYVMVRVLARQLGVDFGMIHPENFKGSSFLKLNMGRKVKGIKYEFFERSEINKDGNEIRDYDWRIRDIEDNTIIDGEFQGEQYYQLWINKIDSWLKTKPLEVPDNLCIVNFRGGEYKGVEDLFLPRSYWLEAMMEMQKINPKMKFRIVTDDVEGAKEFFWGLDMTVGHEISEDWRAIRNAKYLILSNSSFAILPALLNKRAEKIIAPLYWAGHNKGYWQLKQNHYERFTYL